MYFPKTSSFIDWFLPLFMILALYKIGGSFSSYGIVMLLIYVLIYLTFFGRRILIHKYIMYFTFGVSAISIINGFRLDLFSVTYINRLALPLLFIIFLGIIIPNLNPKTFYRNYKIVGIIAMVIISYHSLRLLIFHIPAIPIKLLPVAPEDQHYWGYFKGLRPSGLFTEPQGYVSFIAPLLILANQKGEKFFGYLISLSMLLSTSSLGVLLIIVIYGYPLFLDKGKSSSKVAMLFIVILLLILYSTLDVFEFSRNKVFSTDFSNDIRLTRGFLIYSTLDWVDLFLGIDNTVNSYVLNNLTFDWVYAHVENKSEHLLGYLTSVSGTFVQFGLFSGLLLLLLFYKLFKNEDKNMRLFLIVIFVLSFSQTLLFNAWFLFYYSIYLGLCDTQKYNLNYFILKYR